MVRPRKKQAIVKERPRKKSEKPAENEEIKAETVEDDPLLPNKAHFRIDEVMEYFDMSRDTINRMVEHGKLICLQERPGAMRRFSRVEILRCRSYLSSARSKMAQ